MNLKYCANKAYLDVKYRKGKPVKRRYNIIDVDEVPLTLKKRGFVFLGIYGHVINIYWVLTMCALTNTENLLTEYRKPEGKRVNEKRKGIQDQRGSEE